MSKRKKFNLLLLHVIKKIHEDSNGVYGAPKIHKKVLAQGYLCSLRLVEKLMKIANISCKIRAKWIPTTTDSNHSLEISPNLLNRNFKAEEPYRSVVSDITYIKINSQWHYLTMILDLFNREILGWSLSENMETSSTIIPAYKNMLSRHKLKDGFLFHSDRGVQYASQEFRRLLKEKKVIQSMSRKGNCWDNAPAESFFKLLKSERVNRVNYKNIQIAMSDLFEYIEIFYNRKRIHSFLNYTSPVEFKKLYKKNKVA